MKFLEDKGINLAEARQNKMNSHIPFHQKFSSTTDAPVTKNEKNSCTSDIDEVRRFFEPDIPKQYIPSICEFFYGNYPTNS